MVELSTSLRTVVGDKTATELADGLDLHTVGDLLRHYPRRYAERGQLTPLRDLQVGDHVTVMAQIAKVRKRPMRQRRGTLLEVELSDGTGALSLTFFNQAWRERDLKPGRQGLFAGKVGLFRHTRQLTHPDYQLVDDQFDVDGFVEALIPVYPATAALASWNIAKAVRTVLDVVGDVPDPLPYALREAHGLLGLRAAYDAIHRPPHRAAVTAATTRLKWDEALVLQVTLAQRRAAARAEPAQPRPGADDGLLAAFDARLPFELTGGQREVGAVLADELAADHPMHRLLQGEVGSGKTVCALRAMLQVVDSGGQAALLAPTEVLAQQHARSIRDMLGPLGQAGELGAADAATRVVLLTGSQGAAARRAGRAEAASGAAGIVVGTHALIQEGVDFDDLGLVVVDEQHRFGVEQRDALRAKGASPPHVLVMTATPIPRTVAMTVYGDLETSALTELPKGRSPIATSVVPASERPTWLARAWDRVREEVAAGHQAYVVCPRIGGDEPDDADADDLLDDEPVEASDDDATTTARRAAAAVLDVTPLLAAGELSGLRVEALHGRMPAEVKDDVMSRFGSGAIDVLVATTVVEVGVDVPNATAMIVLDADRFGVSQLHQLRGRVGRGTAPGVCLLVTESASGTPARERLDAVAATLDGFELARLDLEQRREGDVLGASQSGRRSSLKLLSLLRDEELIRSARDEAQALVAADPGLDRQPALRAAIEELVSDDRADYLQKA